MKLKNKISVVIGGGSGIGAAIASRFASEGSVVYATSRKPFQPQKGEQIIPLLANAGIASDVKGVIERIRSESGRIDVLVLNAGISDYAELGDITEDVYDRIFGLNVRSLVFAAQDALDVVSDGGSIVLIGSIADAIGPKGYGVYSASKSAVRSFARTWANELAPRRIRVNVVSPGPTDTAMMAATTDEVRATLTSMIPLGRLGRPDEVAAAALFLASDESSFTTGAELCVDGGATQV